MTPHTIYFSIFNKKMKTTVMARNEAHAREIIIEKIVFYDMKDNRNNEVDMIMRALGIKS